MTRSPYRSPIRIHMTVSPGHVIRLTRLALSHASRTPAPLEVPGFFLGAVHHLQSPSGRERRGMYISVYIGMYIIYIYI